jgi:hypothetical protein
MGGVCSTRKGSKKCRVQYIGRQMLKEENNWEIDT